MNTKRIVITGVGVVQPLTAAFNEKFHLCGRIEDDSVVNKRLSKKIDNFCVNGMIAADKALKMSGLDIIDPYEIGISVGNCFGGWNYIEEEVIQLHKDGVKAVSPYVATAWFPAALQGQLSLKYGIKGFSKTFSMSDIAGMQAIGYAMQTIRQGKCKVMLAGASEDFSSKFVQRVLEDSYVNAASNETLGANTTRFFSDGAAFFVLEEYDSAIERDAKILCELQDFLDTSIESEDKIQKFYEDNSGQFDYSICYKDGFFDREDTILEKLLPKNAASTVSMKDALGNQSSVSGPMNVVYGIKQLENRDSSVGVCVQKLNYMNRINILVLK